MGTLAAAGTSNSKTATEPPDASPSSRNRIANCPILISSLGLVAMRTPPVLGFTYSNAAELPMRPTTGLLPPDRYNHYHSDINPRRWQAPLHGVPRDGGERPLSSGCLYSRTAARNCLIN